MRILNTPPLNCVLIGIYLLLLAKLSWNFKDWYAKFALGTTALTNLLLLGLSDLLAQSLRSAANYAQTKGEMSNTEAKIYDFVISNGRTQKVWLDEAGDSLMELGLSEAEPPVLSGELPPNDLLEFNFIRFGLFSLWGVMNSVFQSLWYAFLRSAYKDGAKLVIVVQRVLTDQLLYSPIMLCLFLLYLAVFVEKEPLTVYKDKLFWRHYIHKLSLNLCIWPAAQFFNFLVIPSALQIPFSSCISVVWNTYLSLSTS